MNENIIENLSVEQIQELYNDILEFGDIIQKSKAAYWYVECYNGRTGVSSSQFEVLSGDKGWACDNGKMRPDGGSAVYQVCGSYKQGSECWNHVAPDSAYWYVECNDGRKGVSTTKFTVLSGDVGWSCDNGKMRPNGGSAVYEVCGSYKQGSECWND